jgi:dGTPase
VRSRFTVVEEDVLYSRAISFMISTLTQNLIRTTFHLLMENEILTPEQGRKSRVKCVSFDSEFTRRKKELKEFLLKEMYANYRVIRMEQKARRIIGDLFRAYTDRPEQLPPQFYSRVIEEGAKRVACDYIAGMTDRYAMEEFRKLFDPLSKV